MKIENQNLLGDSLMMGMSKAGSGAVDTETSIELDRLDPMNQIID